MSQQKIIDAVSGAVKKELAYAEGGHDWFHIERVWKLAKHIGAAEGNADMLTVELGALLHDIADSKFYDGDEEVGPHKARAILENLTVDSAVIDHVEHIIRSISFKGSLAEKKFSSPEFFIVQDADRVDALGAIGIARTFNYGGHVGRALYDPEIPAHLSMTKEQYMASTAPTLNHFYEKLFLLKDLMNTDAGKAMAQQRHDFMKQFVDQFFAEWEGDK